MENQFVYGCRAALGVYQGISARFVHRTDFVGADFNRSDIVSVHKRSAVRPRVVDPVSYRANLGVSDRFQVKIVGGFIYGNFRRVGYYRIDVCRIDRYDGRRLRSTQRGFRMVRIPVEGAHGDIARRLDVYFVRSFDCVGREAGNIEDVYVFVSLDPVDYDIVRAVDCEIFGFNPVQGGYVGNIRDFGVACRFERTRKAYVSSLVGVIHRERICRNVSRKGRVSVYVVDFHGICGGQVLCKLHVAADGVNAERVEEDFVAEIDIVGYRHDIHSVRSRGNLSVDDYARYVFDFGVASAENVLQFDFLGLVCSCYGNIAHVRGRSNVSAGAADNKSADDIAVCGNLVVGRADIDGTRNAHGINRYRAVGSAYCGIAVDCVHQRRSADLACNREVADAGNFGVAAYVVPYLHVLRVFDVERASRHCGYIARNIGGLQFGVNVVEGDAAAALLVYAGIRPREVRRLTWRDIDTEEKTITVRSQCSKTGGVRQVEIPHVLDRLLMAHSRELKEGKICPTNWQRRWRKIRDNSGFRGCWVCDVLRHTYASFHAKRCADLPRLQLNMGHRDLSLLRSRYVNMHGISRADAKRFFEDSGDCGKIKNVKQ